MGRVWWMIAAYGLMTLVAVVIRWATGIPLTRHPAPMVPQSELAFGISLAFGAAIGIVAIVVTRWLLMRAGWARTLRAEFRMLVDGMSPLKLVLVGLTSGVAEELFFRGAIQPLAGLVPTSLVFGLVHIGPRREFLPWTLSALGMGFALGGLYEATGFIEGPMLAHALINMINLQVIARHDAALGDGDIGDEGRPRTPRLVARVQRR